MTRLELSKKMIDATDKAIEAMNEIIEAMVTYDKISGNPDDDSLENAVNNFKMDVQRYTIFKMGFNLLHMVNSVSNPIEPTENTEM